MDKGGFLGRVRCNQVSGQSTNEVRVSPQLPPSFEWAPKCITGRAAVDKFAEANPVLSLHLPESAPLSSPAPTGSLIRSLGLGICPGRDAERRNHRFARSNEIRARAFVSDAAAAHSSALNQKNQCIGEQVRPRCARGSAKSGQTVALTDLEFFDHPQPRMALFSQFDGGVRKVAAALVPFDKFRGLLDKAVKLADWISRAGGFDLRHTSSDFFPL